MGIAPRTLYHWQSAPEKTLGAGMQKAVKDFYAVASPKVRAAFARELAGEGPPVGPQGAGVLYVPSLADSLTALGTLGHEAGRYAGSLDATTQAAIDWLVTPTLAETVALGRAVTAIDVAEIRQTTAALDSLERTIAGDHCRASAVQYLRSAALPRLRGSIPDAIRSDLFSAAAALCELIGWMAYDADEHGLAQRYFVQGLRLARESGDVAYAAYILSTMSHQALYLQSPRHALRLALLASDQAARVTNPTVQTEALVLEARAHAALGDAQAGPVALARAERAFGKPIPADTPEWSKAWSDVLFASHVGTSWVELGKPTEAETAFQLVWDSAGTQPRRRVYSGVYLGRAALLRGDLDVAAAYAREILPGIAATASRRSRTEVRTLITALGEYSSVGTVRDLTEELRIAVGDPPPTT